MDGEYYDCYVLVRSRSPDLVSRFLDRFVPNRREAANEYEVPQYAESPAHIFNSAATLLEHLSSHQGEHHAVYWDSLGADDTKRGMVFPTSDGAMIMGLSCGADGVAAQRLLGEMKAFLGSEVATIWSDEPAPKSAAEFIHKLQTEQVGEDRRVD